MLTYYLFRQQAVIDFRIKIKKQVCKFLLFFHSKSQKLFKFEENQ